MQEDSKSTKSYVVLDQKKRVFEAILKVSIACSLSFGQSIRKTQAFYGGSS